MVRFYGAMFREGDVWICMEVSWIFDFKTWKIETRAFSKTQDYHQDQDLDQDKTKAWIIKAQAQVQTQIQTQL